MSAVLTASDDAAALPPARQDGTWDAFGFHAAVCAATWACLLLFGLMLGSCQLSWQADRVERWLRPFVKFFTGHRIYLLVSLAVSLGMCVLHVVRAEFSATIPTWDMIELCAQFHHLVETLFIWLWATSRSMSNMLQYAFGRLIADCLIIVSVLLCRFQVREEVNFSYVASIRVLVLFGYFLDSRGARSNVKLLVVHSVVRLACAIFCAGALIRQLENIRGPEPPPTALNEIWTLEASIYFVMMSVLTVGYGDLSPQTYLGQILSVFIVVLGTWLMLRTVLGVMQAVDSNRAGSGCYDKSRARHIVVTGTPSFQVLRDFLVELYNEDLGSQCEELNVVILLQPGQRHVVDQMRDFLRQPCCGRFHHSVWMVQGSALRQEDLRRVNYGDAVMAFLLPNLYTDDAERQDIDNGMRAVSMRRHVPFVRIIALLMKAEHRDTFLSVGLTPGDIVCMDELKHGFVAKSCEAQGFSTMACGLFKRAGGILQEMDIREAKISWIQEYLKGLSNEMFEVPLSNAYNGAPFGEVSVDVMLRSEGRAYFIGTIEEPYYPGDETLTSIFPGKHTKVGIHEDRKCLGIFVAQSRDDIVQYPPGSPFPWRNDPESRAQMAAQAAEGKEAPSDLPGSVAEVIASDRNEGWVREPRDIKAEKAEGVKQASVITAAQWAAQGLRQTTKLERSRIQELVGLQATTDIQDPSKAAGGHLSAEDDPEYATDPTQKALLEAQFAEEDQVARLSEAAQEEKVMYIARKVVAVAEELEDRRRQYFDHPERDKEEDAKLWGYPQQLPPKSFGSEPRPAQLVRGGHIVVMAIEGPPADGPKSVDGAGTGDPSKRIGRGLGVVHFVRSLRAGDQRRTSRARIVVVVSETTPKDWKKAAKEGGVYLVLGKPSSANALKRAGVEQAHAVVVHQRNASMDRDPSTVDAEAVFACRLAERMLAAIGRDVPVICDLHLSVGAGFLPFTPTFSETGDVAGKDEEEDTRKLKPMDGKISPFCVQSRFVSGHLFVSSIATTLVANMFYKHSLGHIVQELLHKQFVVIPMPEDFKGRTFGQLFEHVMRKNNLMPMAVLRFRDIQEEDLEEQQDHVDDLGNDDTVAVLKPVLHAEDPLRWSHGEPPADRFAKIMPFGEARVAEHDGILCAVANFGRVVFPPVKPTPPSSYASHKRTGTSTRARRS